MRVPLKGLNRVRKRLASGQVKDYYYLGKGGPPVHGEYGSPEFHASYNEAAKTCRPVRKDDLQSLIDRYLASSDFLNLADATRKLYKYHLGRWIETQFGDLPIAALGDRAVRADILDWRDEIGKISPRQADQAFRALARIISWGVDRGIAPANPCLRARRLYHGNRRDSVWTPEQEKAFMAAAPKHLQLALLLALWTGQRQGDLLRLTWSAYDGSHIRLKQRKTGAEVSIPVGRVLKTALDEAKALLDVQGDDAAHLEGRTILTTMRGNRFTSEGFRTIWHRACQKAGIVGVTFHDLRGTAVTRLATAGATIPEIATITGHTFAHVHSVIEYYLKRDSKLAESAIRKLEKGTKLPTKRPTGA